MRLLPVVFIVAVAACASFESAPDNDAPTTTDAGEAGAGDAATPDASDGALGDAPAPATKGCPPAAANTTCWDFDTGEDTPAIVQQYGAFALDPSTSYSPARSLHITTSAIPSNTVAWAYFQQPIANAPPIVTLDMRILVPSQAKTEIGELRMVGGNTFYAVTLGIDQGSLSVYEGTYVNETPSDVVSHPLGSSTGWTHVVLRLETSGLGTSGAHRKLYAAVAETDVLAVTSDDLDLTTLKPSQTLVSAGITGVSSYSGISGAARTMNVDTVLVSWTP